MLLLPLPRSTLIVSRWPPTCTRTIFCGLPVHRQQGGKTLVEEAFQLKASGVLPLKKPMVPFSRFVRDRLSDPTARESGIANNGTYNKFISSLSSEWARLTDAQRQAYTDAYRVDMAEYRQRLASEGDKYKAKPRRPSNALHRYTKEQASLGVTRGRMAKWKAMSAEEKKPYEDSFEADMKAYRKRLIEWKHGLQEGSIDHTKALTTRGHDVMENASNYNLSLYAARFKQTLDSQEQFFAKNVLPSRPIRPYPRFQHAHGLSSSAASFKWFLHDFMRSKAESRTPSHRLTLTASEVWRNMTEEQKAPYREAYSKDLAEYREAQVRKSAAVDENARLAEQSSQEVSDVTMTSH
ncbi:hypothetical protein EIP91_007610 [Steccherinum ochraceum]|uniref:HMG box domain-containing protein n=1 Tax=Steccherinum ochraceum TaxID=92696 RepID=A0A4R0R9S0_9APHY|nr:hypothetical protein EIP91_007610 [Steccherinum ochraceum]